MRVAIFVQNDVQRLSQVLAPRKCPTKFVASGSLNSAGHHLERYRESVAGAAWNERTPGIPETVSNWRALIGALPASPFERHDAGPAPPRGQYRYGIAVITQNYGRSTQRAKLAGAVNQLHSAPLICSSIRSALQLEPRQADWLLCGRFLPLAASMLACGRATVSTATSADSAGAVQCCSVC